MFSFSYLEPVCCSMSSSNCCFLTCTQVSQEAGQVVWYSHLFQNFPQFVVIHTVKGFGIVNKAEIDVFLELSCFFHDPLASLLFSNITLCASGPRDSTETEPIYAYTVGIWPFDTYLSILKIDYCWNNAKVRNVIYLFSKVLWDLGNLSAACQERVK